MKMRCGLRKAVEWGASVFSRFFHGRSGSWPAIPCNLIRLLDSHDLKNARALLYGGGSGVEWWAAKVKSLLIVESDLERFKAIRGYGLHNVKLLLRSKQHGLFEDAPKIDDSKFDIIVIGHVNREQCLRASLDYVSGNGIIVLPQCQSPEKAVELFGAIVKPRGYHLREFVPVGMLSLFSKRSFVVYNRNTVLDLKL